MVPTTMALKARRATTGRCFSDMDPSAPITIPIDDRLAKPHRAYVQITSERGWNDTRGTEGYIGVLSASCYGDIGVWSVVVMVILVC